MDDISRGALLEPTSKQIADALAVSISEEIFSKADYCEMCAMNTQDAIGWMFGILIENGSDPEAFLKEKGIVL